MRGVAVETQQSALTQPSLPSRPPRVPLFRGGLPSPTSSTSSLPTKHCSSNNNSTPCHNNINSLPSAGTSGTSSSSSIEENLNLQQLPPQVTHCSDDLCNVGDESNSMLNQQRHPFPSEQSSSSKNKKTNLFLNRNLSPGAGTLPSTLRKTSSMPPASSSPLSQQMQGLDLAGPSSVDADEPSSPPEPHFSADTNDDLFDDDLYFLEQDSSLQQQQPRSLSGYLANTAATQFEHDEEGRNCLSMLAGGASMNPSHGHNHPHSIFRRKSKKISSVDVASVGNASDTMVSVNSRQQLSGRELHENAKVLFNAGDFTKALPLFEAILSAQVRRFSPLHSSVGAAMHNVGVVRQRLGQHDLAENLFSEAVQIRQRTLGGDHLDVAISLSKLGASRVALAKLDKAFDNLREALHIAQYHLGRQHKTVAQMLCHLGCFFYEAGELFAAQSTFADAVEIYRAVWSQSADRDECMAQLTDVLCNIGSIQNRRKMFSAAIDTFQEALDLQRGIVENNDARIVATLDNLAYSYSKNRDYTSALNCYRKMLKGQVARAGTFTSACYDTLLKQILMYRKLKRTSEAVEEVREILQMQRRMLPADDPIIGKTERLLEEMTHKSKTRTSSTGNNKAS